MHRLYHAALDWSEKMPNLTLFLDNNCDIFDLIISKNVLTDIKILKNINTYTFLFCEKEKALLKIADIITEFIIENYETGK